MSPRESLKLKLWPGGSRLSWETAYERNPVWAVGSENQGSVGSELSDSMSTERKYTRS